MPSTRPKLSLDQDSFQGLLAAAFTIQQYNDREGGIDAALSAELNATLGSKITPTRKLESVSSAVEVSEPQEAEIGETSIPSCQQCGLPLRAAGTPCPICDAETFRPGERLQRTWATMWEMSKEQGGIPGQFPLPQSGAAEQARDAASQTGSRTHAPHLFHEDSPAAVPGLVLDEDAAESLRILPAERHAEVAASTAARADSVAPHLKVRFRRADLYLGLAVLVALVALLWPSASAGRAELRPWERILIAMGIAEAPSQADVHYDGDPNIKVWVDTEAALYYCPGDELYGKSHGGYYTTQHDAQLDRFEPALRRACVP
ncbi:MAG TPA: hypothetical protein VMI10_21630 [Terriglobales bacterium]|nr:hypothetical protein [Terriglobales bacterium]